ncbi:MAG: histidine kinase [Burkholderiales bacterium]|nr:histidine kinase [Burkholderiales bacterium]
MSHAVNNPRSPAALLLAAAVICLGASAAMLWLALQQPWLGLQLQPQFEQDRIEIVAASGPTAALATPSTLRWIAAADGSRRIDLRATDLIEEPDFFQRYEEMVELFTRQQQISELLAAGPVQLGIALPDGSVQTASATAQARPVSDLPFVFWFQLAAGCASVLIGCWVWVLRPRDWGARMFALTGLLFALAALPAAVYSTRPLALDGHTFEWLSRANHAGSIIFGAAFVGLFLSYPRLLVRPSRLLWPAAAALGWYGAHLLHAWPDVDWGLRVPIMLSMGAAIACAIVQWRRTAGDPASRAALRWFALAAIFGCGLFVAVIVASTLLRWLPPMRQGYALGFFLIMYIGLALGLRRYRLFDLDQWAYRILLWAGGALLLLALDATLVFALRLEPTISLGLALLIVGFGWLPLRQTLWQRMVERKPMAEHEMFHEVIQLAFAASPQQRARQWQGLLRRLFDPLEIAPLDADADVRLRDDGVTLDLPAVASSGPLRLRYPWGGRALFSVRHRELALQLVELLRLADASRDAYERGALEERHRIARDLHDDVGSRLLSSLHRQTLDDTRRLIRHAIADIRTVVSGLNGRRLPLTTIVAELRHETGQRLEAAGIELDWPLPPDDAVLPNLDYRLYKHWISMIRELVSNAIRHARCTRLSVQVSFDGDRLVTEVRDDGIGMGHAPGAPDTSGASGAPGAEVPGTGTHGGHGLAGLRRRAAELGGSVELHTGDTGTAVRFDLPLAPPRAEPADTDKTPANDSSTLAAR